MIKKWAFIFLLFSFCFVNAQHLWKKQTEAKDLFSKSNLRLRKNTPSKFTVYALDVNNFKSSLLEVSENKISTLYLPYIDGTLKPFLVKEDTNFTKQVNARYGYIKSFSAQGVEDPTAVAKISVGTDGVHIIITSGNQSTFYIDPYTKDSKNYIAYQRANLTAITSFSCEINKTTKTTNRKKTITTLARGADDSKLRNYRLALACTGEYAQFHLTQQGIASTATEAEKKAAVLSAMNTTITRINAVYERDLAVKLTIVLNDEGENELIFLDASTDNLTNDEASTLINENQTLCDAKIGTANYDIGHVFSTGAGGLAGLGVVCIEGEKAGGVTGTNEPINDPYDIDFVAHEIGHQFGASHTFNNSCDGNRSNATSVEPGSGSTIMSYAGICNPNVQNNSDDYFHAISIQEMWAHIQASGDCRDHVATNINNTAPTANAGVDVIMPKSTPFILKGTATDSDGTTNLTYSWEQIDTEITTQPPLATNTVGPSFRSLPPTTSPNRYMPALATVVNSNTSIWEVLPAVARTMNFSLLVRDNYAGVGASARDDIQITVANIDPFTVTSQTTNETWSAGTTQTVTWNKSTTDIAPINCSNVKIKLSTDGGLTFPITLVESTPNDGTHTFTVPEYTTTMARIMVEAVDNLFYNVNSANFTIISSEPTFVISNASNQQEACNTAGNTVSYTLNLDFINGFSENVTLSAINTPEEASVSFNPSTINTDGEVIMTITNFDDANAQLYTINVIGTSETSNIKQNTEALLNLIGTNFADTTLTSPTDGATQISITPQLTWQADNNASSYIVEVATDNAFTNTVATVTVNTNAYNVSSVLNSLTTYYWRVKPKNNCVEGSFSNPFSFTTATPSYCAATHAESVNSEWISNVTFNSINNNSSNDHNPEADDGYEDFTHISTTVDRGSTYELSVSLNTAGFQDHVYVYIDWNQDYIFNTTTERYDLGAQTTATATTTLNITIPENAMLGTTRMRVIIEYYGSLENGTTATAGNGACTQDFESGWGETEDYTLKIQDSIPTIPDQVFSGFNLYPNPSNGEMNLVFDTVSPQEVNIQLYDLNGRKITEQIFNNIPEKFSETLKYNVASGVYLLKIKNGEKESTRKIIVK